MGTCNYSQREDLVPLAILRQLISCTVNSTTGWQDNTSFQVAKNGTTHTWSWIYGNEIEVNPNERYELLTHMKLNDFANSSHIAVEAYNETLKQWIQIEQCPYGIDGPIEWRQFRCEITVPESTSKVRLALNAGWSSQENEQAITLFDAIYMFKLTDESPNLQNLDPIKKVISDKQNNQLRIINDYTRINPTQWNVRTTSSEPFTVGFAEPYDSAWKLKYTRMVRKWVRQIRFLYTGC